MSYKSLTPLARQTSSLLPRSARQACLIPASHLRNYATQPPISSDPLPTPKPIYPPPSDPFHPPPAASPSSSSTQQTATKHSPLKVSIVKTLARLMGYNTRSVTAIRETGNMVGSIVRAVERDHEFWYNECDLPPTYQSFFQLHLLYLLLLLPRLRALPNSSASSSSTPETLTPPPSNPSTPSAASAALPTSTPLSQTYLTEILTHFFALAENQMRMTLGERERERVVRGYMKEMGEQWKGAGVGFDYALARGQGGLPHVSGSGAGVGVGDGFENGGDGEMAAWVWRNLFAARGSEGSALSSSNSPTESDTEQSLSLKHLKLSIQLNQIVQFIRRELYRLENVGDEEVVNGRIGEFGRVREVEKGGVETEDGA